MMKKITAILLPAILLISLLSACGSNGSADYRTSESGSAPSSAPMAPRDDMYEYEVYYDADMQYGGESATESAPMPMTVGNRNGGNDSLSDVPTEQAVADSGVLSEKIIYTASAEIQTVDFDETVERVYDLLNLNGAFIESSYIGGRNYMQSYYGYQTYRSAHFILRVPKNRFAEVTDSLDILGNVTSLSTNAENITAQFFDTESRLASYRIQEERLLAMLEQADTVTDMITIESRLADVRYSIESLVSSLKNMQSQVDYSTLTLYINEVEKFTEIVPIQRTYWQQVGDGLLSKVKDVGEFFKDLLKWVIVNIPVLAVLAVLVIVVVVIVRARIRKRRMIYKNNMNQEIK